MTYREEFTLPAELLERVSKQGFDILPELIQVIINACRVSQHAKTPLVCIRLAAGDAPHTSPFRERRLRKASTTCGSNLLPD